jgi:hypothetical protein
VEHTPVDDGLEQVIVMHHRSIGGGPTQA